LFPTLDSLRDLDYGNHQVDRLIIDDYPRTRNDAIFDLIGKRYNFKLKLNSENKGLSVNWTDFFNYLRSTDYDYILHQEDDVVLLEPVRIDDLIDCLESNEKMSSVTLQRQPWYFHENPTKLEPNDTEFRQYYYSRGTKIFPIIFSLYRKSIVDYPFREYWGFNLNEGMIMVYLDHFHQMFNATLKNSQGGNIIEHIGEESTGKRILQGEPNWEQFAHMDPDKVYTSREGRLVE
jgi:hypothetical protein